MADGAAEDRRSGQARRDHHHYRPIHLRRPRLCGWPRRSPRRRAGRPGHPQQGRPVGRGRFGPRNAGGAPRPHRGLPIARLARGGGPGRRTRRPGRPNAPEPATSTTPTPGDKAAHQTKPEHRTWQRWAADPTEPKRSAPGNSNNPDPGSSTGPHHSATTTASTTKAPPGSTTPTDSTSPTESSGELGTLPSASRALRQPPGLPRSRRSPWRAASLRSRERPPRG